MSGLHARLTLVDESGFSECLLAIDIDGSSIVELHIAAGVYDDAYALTDALDHQMAQYVSGGSARLIDGRVVLNALVPFRPAAVGADVERLAALPIWLGFDPSATYSYALEHRASSWPPQAIFHSAFYEPVPDTLLLYGHQATGLSGEAKRLLFGTDRRLSYTLEYLSESEAAHLERFLAAAADGRPLALYCASGIRRRVVLTESSLGGPAKALKRRPGAAAYYSATLNLREEAA